MTSHEFRTPLATILSATELLEKYGERLPAPEKDEMTGLIKAAVVRMTTMLEDVLLIGKADAGRVDFHPLPVDIGRLAAVVVEEVGRATMHRCPIAMSIDGDCTARMLDEKLVRHILSNLLSNAAKYSPAGSAVQLSVCCDEGATQFEVIDHGIGIPAEDQPRLYSTFHRGGNVSNVSGTGLGLAIVKKCVDVHGGRIGFESAPGAARRSPCRCRRRRPPEGQQLPKVLLIEDEAPIRATLSRFLRLEGSTWSPPRTARRAWRWRWPKCPT
jgi:signal transduction histidine kinase